MRLQTVLVHHGRFKDAFDDVRRLGEASRQVTALHHRFTGQVAGCDRFFFPLFHRSAVRFCGGGIEARHAFRPDERRPFSQRFIDAERDGHFLVIHLHQRCAVLRRPFVFRQDQRDRLSGEDDAIAR